MFRNISGETDEEMQGLNLKPLQNFVQRVIILSEETKSVLQSDCDEARFALKSWPNETIIHKEMDKICTCNAMELDDQLQINDIDRSILQRQELKEKLKTNLLRERSRTRKPDVREIYMPKSKSLTRLKRSSSKSHSRFENRQESRSKITSEKICDENNPRETKRRSSSSNRQIEVGSKSASLINKKLPQLSQNGSKVNLKTGSQTNYVLANKQNFIKNTKPSEKNNRLPPLVRAESTLSNEFIKMQVQNPPEIIDERPLQNENCPFHANNTNTKTVKSVDAVEGLDRHGVPSSLVKVLKVYHPFLKINNSETATRDKRSEEASAKFLMEFNNMCNQREKHNSKSEKIPTLVKGFIEILGGPYDRDTNRTQKNELKTKYSNLDSEYKNIFHDKKDTRRSKISECCRNLHLNKRGWMSNGIWNDLCITNFEEMLKTLCIRYSSRAQLVSLFDALQQLQRAKYQEVLVHYLLHKVVPDAKKFLDSNSKEFSEAYKMCFTIIQVLNPKATVLVRTE